MKKYLITLLAVFSSIAVNAQIGSEMGFILDVPYNHAYSTPLVRSMNDTVIVAYYEHDYHGVFVVLQNNSLQADTIELNHHQYVYDFEILGNSVFFCGKTIDISDLYHTEEHALVGWFSLASLLGGGTNVTISYNEFDVAGRDHNRLKKMIVYKDSQNLKKIMAIGESFLCNTPNQPCHSGIDFFASIDASYGFISELFPFSNEVYHDIIETDNYVVLVGGDFGISASNSICFRKIMKYNIQSVERDYLYKVDIPHIEPSTFIYGTQIGGNRFITSTFGYINGKEGTIIRTYNASNMGMMAAQFIPSPGEKTQPYELTYVQETQKVLLLQLSTNNPSTRIYTIDPYPTQNYSTIWEYHPNWHLHSFDMYRNDEYIVMGTTGQTPAFYARNILYNNPNCVNQNTVNVEKIDKFEILRLHIPLNMNNPIPNNDSYMVISSECNLSVGCN